MYMIGSRVIYRAEGVCVIKDIREESFGAIGEKNKYYILSPIEDDGSTLFVPVDNERLCSFIRPLLSAEEIVALAAEVRDERLDWIPDSRARNLKYKEILSVGDRRDIMILVNTILDIKKEGKNSDKHLTGTDETALRRSKHMLYDEFCVTVELRVEDDVFALLSGELIPTPKQ